MVNTVLIVEDEMLIAFDMQSSLEELGYVAIVAASVAEAIAALDSIDIAILDYHVGRGDTSQLAAALREKGKPFVICSGSMLDELGEVFGGATLLGKPFRLGELSAAISSLIGSKGSLEPA